MKGSSWVAAVGTAALVFLGASGAAGFTTLKGSHEKMVRQNTVAHEDHYQFAEPPQDIASEVAGHQLVALPGSADYSTKGVSFAFARPPVLYVVERLAYEYHQACGEAMVITSLVRPIALQPRNASPLSVHPAGMAVDLHVPDDPVCRSWLVKRLVTLAGYNVLDVTEEMHPHHLHVAVFPHAYLLWLAKQPKPAGPPAGSGHSAGVLASRTAKAPALTSLGMGDARTAVFASALGLFALAAVGFPLRRRARARSRRVSRVGRPGTRAD